MQDNTSLIAQAQKYLEAACPDNDPAAIAPLLDRFSEHKSDVLQGKEFAIALQQHVWKHVLPALGCNPLRGVHPTETDGPLLTRGDVSRFMKQHGHEAEYDAACNTDAKTDMLTRWQEALAEAVDEATEAGLMDTPARQGVLNMILACTGEGDDASVGLSTERLKMIVQLLGMLEEFPTATTNHADIDTKDVEIASLKHRIADLEKAVAQLPKGSAEEGRAAVQQQHVHAAGGDDEDGEEEDPFPFGTANGSYRHRSLPQSTDWVAFV